MQSTEPKSPEPVILAICGSKNSGKTTLIESLVPALKQEGLSVAAILHSDHELNVDHPGKDTDRVYRSGADVLAYDGGQTFLRKHGASSLDDTLRLLGSGYDMILVEGHKHSELSKLWLLSEGEDNPPEGIGEVIAALSKDQDRVAVALEAIRKLMSDR